MNILEEIKKYFYAKGEVFNKQEATQMASMQANGFKGPADLAANPGLHVAGRWWKVKDSGAYANFPGEDGFPVTIPPKPDGTFITNGSIYDNGTFYVLMYDFEAVPEPEFDFELEEDEDDTRVLTFKDKNDIEMFGVKPGNKFFATGYSSKHIPADALKDGEVDKTKLTPALTTEIENAGLPGVTTSESDLASGDILTIYDKNNLPLASWTMTGFFYPNRGYKAKSVPLTALEDFVQTIITNAGSVKPWLKGQKLVTLGHSIVYGETWQPTVVQYTGMVYNSDETTTGVGGHAPMGVGGSCIKPIVRAETGCATGQSIYMRADDVHFYNPDVIIIMGGQNDKNRGTLGSVNDDPYTGGEIAATDPHMTFAAAYKGMLLKLIQQNPAAKIFTSTLMWNGYGTVPATADLGNMESVNVLIRSISNLFSIPCVDLFRECQITPLNSNLFYGDYATNAIHPNAAGGKRIGEVIVRAIN
jgi:lysophospholipase L1-like esterase